MDHPISDLSPKFDLVLPRHLVTCPQRSPRTLQPPPPSRRPERGRPGAQRPAAHLQPRGGPASAPGDHFVGGEASGRGRAGGEDAHPPDPYLLPQGPLLVHLPLQPPRPLLGGVRLLLQAPDLSPHGLKRAHRRHARPRLASPRRLPPCSLRPSPGSLPVRSATQRAPGRGWGRWSPARRPRLRPRPPRRRLRVQVGAPGLRGAAAPPGGAGRDRSLPPAWPRGWGLAARTGSPAAARDAAALRREARRHAGEASSPPLCFHCRQPALPPLPCLFPLSPHLSSEYWTSCRAPKYSASPKKQDILKLSGVFHAYH